MLKLRPRLPGLVEELEKSLPYGSILLSSRQGLHFFIDDHQEQVNEIAPTAGTVVSAFDGATMHERAVGGFALEAVERAARELSREVKKAGPLTPDAGPERRRDFVSPMQIPPESLPVEEKLERCHELHRRLRGLDSRIVNVRVNYEEANHFDIFANRRADLAQRVQRLKIFMRVIVSQDNQVRSDYTQKAGTGGWEVLNFSDAELHSLVDNAVALLSAERIEPGEYSVVAAPGISGTLAHESFGHGVETDMFLKERARAAHYLGRQVGSPLVNILDDPSYPAAYSSYFFDDEGWLAGPTQIVENGIFLRGLSDLYSATALGLPRTANGRRQDYTRKAYARMSNTYFASGALPVSNLIAQVDQGIYLARGASGMEDPQGWGIQVICHYGHEIKHGRITGRIFAPVGITGYVPDVLDSISAVGQDWDLEGGGCGKGLKEWISTSVGGPHLLFKAKLG
jgi:TldD protein